MAELDLPRLTDLQSGVVGASIHHMARVDSTMNEARALAEGGAEDGLVVVAEEQTMGRGRFERRWISAPGLDLTFSVVLRPRPHQLRMVNMAATMAVQEAAAGVTGRPAAIKWPNDVVMSGRKVSGILVESFSSRLSGLDFAVVGIGLNVNLPTRDHAEIRDIATSLAEQAGLPVDRTGVLIEVLRRLDGLYSALRCRKDLAEMWSQRIDTIGRSVRVRSAELEIVGRACGVDGEGNLLVETANGVAAVVAGDVTITGSRE